MPGTLPGAVWWTKRRSPKARRELFDCLAFCSPPNEQFLGYPVAGPQNDLREGHRRYNFIWYRPASSTQLRSLLTDESGYTHPISIPPNFVRREVVNGLRDAARQLLPPQFQEAIVPGRRGRSRSPSTTWSRRARPSGASCCWATPLSWCGRTSPWA